MCMLADISYCIFGCRSGSLLFLKKIPPSRKRSCASSLPQAIFFLKKDAKSRDLRDKTDGIAAVDISLLVRLQQQTAAPHHARQQY